MIRTIIFAILIGLPIVTSIQATAAEPSNDRRNLLVITVDDMSCDSIGVFGSRLRETSPNIDRLARQSLRFQHAHVQVGNCMPSRNVMFSGLYPHNNGVEGFYQVKNPKHPHLADLMKDAGYHVSIFGKVSHSAPFQPYHWSLNLSSIEPSIGNIKDPTAYYRATKQAISDAREQEKPYCSIINISDPHKPFYGIKGRGQVWDDPNRPTRVFTADEVPVPGFLPDTPAIRQELAHYYSSVRRADDCVGNILKALEESGTRDQTAIVFLSDHGMPLPFAKTQLYHHSTWTPLVIHVPGVTKPDTVDDRHMVSAVDFLPTFLDMIGADHPERLDGRSFWPIIESGAQEGRNRVFKEYQENSGGFRNPMRVVQTRRFGYHFNPWSNGERKMKTATTGTASYRELKRLAETDQAVAARLNLFDHRVVEEFYDYENDPDGLVNLIDDPKLKSEISELRSAMKSWMKETGDDLLEAFEQRDDPQALEKYMTRVQAESDERRKNKRKNNRKNK